MQRTGTDYHREEELNVTYDYITMAKCLGSSSLGAQPDTYLYKLAQATDNANLFATIGSDDALRLFDPSLRSLSTFSKCHTGLSTLISLPGQPSTFVTAGRDGLIKVWDARQPTSIRKPALQLAEPSARPISALTASAQGPLLAAGTESNKEGLGDVSVLVFDLRNASPSSAPLRNYAESHTDSITQLAFHPTQPSVLLSGSTDGLVSLFDVTQGDEEEALQRVLNPRSAVHCSGFLTETTVWVLTTDEQFLIYALSEDGIVTSSSEAEVLNFGDVREKLRCMYVIDLVREPSTGQPVLAYGHNERQTLGMAQLVGDSNGNALGSWDLGQKVALPGAHGEEVVRDLLLARDGRRAYSCGEDGTVKVWQV